MHFYIELKPKFIKIFKTFTKKTQIRAQQNKKNNKQLFKLIGCPYLIKKKVMTYFNMFKGILRIICSECLSQYEFQNSRYFTRTDFCDIFLKKIQQNVNPSKNCFKGLNLFMALFPRFNSSTSIARLKTLAHEKCQVTQRPL